MICVIRYIMNDKEKYLAERQALYDEAHQRALERFPKSGHKLRYRATTPIWDTDLIENAERELRTGEIYTLKSIDLGRAFCHITLKETGEAEYELAFFDIFSDAEQKFKHPLDYEYGTNLFEDKNLEQ